MTEILEDYKNLFSFDTIQSVDENKIVPLMRWLSYEPSNLGICLKVNKYIKYIDKKIAVYALHFKINKQKQFIRTIKKPDEEDKLEFLKIEIQNHYKWTDKELIKNWKVIEMFLKDKEYVKELDRSFAFTEEQCKLLDIPYIKPTIEKLKIEKTYSISSWF